MKLTLVTTLLYITAIGGLHAKIKIVPLDTEYGLWVTTTNTNQEKMMDKMLEKYPESQRAMMKKMMSKMIPKNNANNKENMKQEQCITKDSYKNMESTIKKSLGQKNTQNCKLNVTKSTSKYFAAVIDCGVVKSTVQTKVINAKRNESLVVTNIPTMGRQEIKAVSVWKSSKCK